LGRKRTEMRSWLENHGEGWKGMIRVNQGGIVKCGSAGGSVGWERTRERDSRRWVSREQQVVGVRVTEVVGGAIEETRKGCAKRLWET